MLREAQAIAKHSASVNLICTWRYRSRRLPTVGVMAKLELQVPSYRSRERAAFKLKERCNVLIRWSRNHGSAETAPSALPTNALWPELIRMNGRDRDQAER